MKNDCFFVFDSSLPVRMNPPVIHETEGPSPPASRKRLRTPTFRLDKGNARDHYSKWPTPQCIVSDGPYGLGLYPGEPSSITDLPAAYEPHIRAWSARASPATTLWFWNTEVGWATVHPVLVKYGWEYQRLHVWDKGLAHVAGNVNGATLRSFPTVTEVCVLYARPLPVLKSGEAEYPLKEWLRREWQRSGLPFTKANEACEVKSAASRKYLARDHVWYLPPPAMLLKMAQYATEHGRETTVPYFSLDRKTAVTEEAWTQLRYPWNFEYGVTNVWHVSALRGKERTKHGAHVNQKPLALMDRILQACTRPGDVVWEPFGGLCSASASALRLGRRPCAAELLETYHTLATQRLRDIETDTALAASREAHEP